MNLQTEHATKILLFAICYLERSRRLLNVISKLVIKIKLTENENKTDRETEMEKSAGLTIVDVEAYGEKPPMHPDCKVFLAQDSAMWRTSGINAKLMLPF